MLDENPLDSRNKARKVLEESTIAKHISYHYIATGEENCIQNKQIDKHA